MTSSIFNVSFSLMACPFLMKYSKKILHFYTNHYFIFFSFQFKANRIIKKHVFVTMQNYSVYLP